MVNGGSKQNEIWQIFAARGMGWFAGAVDGDDTTRSRTSRCRRRPNTPRGSLTGTVTDADTGAPVAGAVVAFGGHNSGFAGSYAATTDAAGNYTINGIFPGTYPKVFARGAGLRPGGPDACRSPPASTPSTGSCAATGRRPEAGRWSTSRHRTTRPSAVARRHDRPVAGLGWGTDAPTTRFPGLQPKFVIVSCPPR